MIEFYLSKEKKEGRSSILLLTPRFSKSSTQCSILPLSLFPYFSWLSNFYSLFVCANETEGDEEMKSPRESNKTRRIEDWGTRSNFSTLPIERALGNCKAPILLASSYGYFSGEKTTEKKRLGEEASVKRRGGAIKRGRRRIERDLLVFW